MLHHFRAMGPNTLRIVLVGIADKKDDASSSTNEMYLDCEAFLAIHRTISPEVFKSISTCKSAHEVWTKLENLYGVSNLDEDDIMMKELVHELFTLFDHKESTNTSISDCLHTSASSISQGNDMVSEEIYVDENVIASMDMSISSTTHSVIVLIGHAFHLKIPRQMSVVICLLSRVLLIKISCFSLVAL